MIIPTQTQFWDKFLFDYMYIKFLPEIQTPFQIHIHILEYLHH